ncbi:MAG: MinD/ParA family protein [Burkholderiales bacterium]
MFDGRRDQAEGLRRLLAAEGPRSFSFFGARPGCGVTSCVISLGAALAQTGRDVLLIDEHDGASNISGQLGLAAGREGRRPAPGHRSAALAGISLAPGLRLLPAAGGVADVERYGSGLSGEPRDIVLIDALSPSNWKNPALGNAAHEVVVVMQADATSITRAYSVMKRLRAEHGISRFRVLVNHCSDGVAARRAVRNLTQAARGFLDASLQYAGAVPLDPAFAVAERRRESLFDSRPSVASARVFRQLALDMLVRAPGLSHGRPDASGRSPIFNQRSHSLAAAGG